MRRENRQLLETWIIAAALAAITVYTYIVSFDRLPTVVFSCVIGAIVAQTVVYYIDVRIDPPFERDEIPSTENSVRDYV